MSKAQRLRLRRTDNVTARLGNLLVLGLFKRIKYKCRRSSQDAVVFVSAEKLPDAEKK